MKDLKQWLSAETFYEGPDAEEVAALRVRVLRAFCVLKCVDLKVQYSEDFNVLSDDPECWRLFREYLLTIMWEELGLSPISEAEEQTILNDALG